jgi:TFIIF-interacting CTD phosphatase-like protein
MSNSKFILNIILDLDLTCIESKEHTHRKKYDFVSHNMEGIYTVYERPGLQEFLEYIFSHFNVSVWTAASADYGLFIVDKILCPKGTNRQLDYFLHSEHCSVSKKLTKSCKNLDMLFTNWQLPGYKRENTIIIDDLDEVYCTQPFNCINIKPFNVCSKYSKFDCQLSDITDQLESIRTKMIKKLND